MSKLLDPLNRIKSFIAKALQKYFISEIRRLRLTRGFAPAGRDGHMLSLPILFRFSPGETAPDQHYFVTCTVNNDWAAQLGWTFTMPPPIAKPRTLAVSLFNISYDTNRQRL